MQAITGTGKRHGGATQGAAVSHAGTRQPIKRLAPYRVFGVVLRLALAGNNSPHCAGLVPGKNKVQQPDNLIGAICGDRKDAGLSHNLSKEAGIDSNPL